jgi:L-asparaginase II
MSDAFPLDFEAITKDSIITQETIERIYRVRWRDDPDGYRLNAQLKLVGEIRSHRHDLEAHVVGKGRDIRILTDREAEENTQQRLKEAMNRQQTYTIRRGAIDRSGFSASELAIAEHRDRFNQANMMMLRKNALEADREELLLRCHTESQKLGE